MSVGIQDNKNLGVVRVTLTTLPQLHPFSAASNEAQNYICYGIDTKGFQVDIDLQAMPPGVTLSQLQADQVWWVEKRTSLYRLFLYAGTFNRTINQVNSTTPLPTSSSTGVPTGTLLDFAGSTNPDDSYPLFVRASDFLAKAAVSAAEAEAAALKRAAELTQLAEKALVRFIL